MVKTRSKHDPMSTISIDSSYAQEIVEFWVHKYQQVKEEIEQLKHSSSEREQQVQKQSNTLQDLIQGLQTENEQRKSTDAELRSLLTQVQSYDIAKRNSSAEAAVAEKLIQVQTTNEDLTKQLAASESEKLALTQQMQLFYTQAAVLAGEADQWRRETVKSMFDSVEFVDETFESRPLKFTHPQLILSAFSTEEADSGRLYFLPRPPTCMPLRVTSCGKHGYWFYPAWLLPEDAEFELIVEGRPSEWSYLGRYVSVVLPGGEMRLSEWIALDEETKMGHCMRVAHQNPSQANQLPQSVTHPLEIKRRYESGEWSVPCFTLRCVGFDMTLYNALHTAADAANKSAISTQGKRKSETPAPEDPDPNNASVKKSRVSSIGKNS